MYTCVIRNHPLSGDEFPCLEAFFKAQSRQKTRNQIKSEGFPLYDPEDLIETTTGDLLCPFTGDIALLITLGR